MEFVEAKNHICSQEFLEGREAGQAWGLPCTSQDNTLGCGPLRAFMCIGIHFPSVTLQQLASPQRPEMPESPRTSALQDLLLYV